MVLCVGCDLSVSQESIGIEILVPRIALLGDGGTVERMGPSEGSLDHLERVFRWDCGSWYGGTTCNPSTSEAEAGGSQ